ncbi:MAG TPA: sigma-70 family RNA polymerase sigma factor [Anaerolineales bacterium]|nr:sigma-70 family RNA polymerase sigma factor [Anaerolineales bacterium]
MTNVRDNNIWLKDLRADGAQRDTALADLRALLLRALPQGLATMLSPENPEFELFVEDTAQETLVRVLNSLDTFEGRSQFTTWAYKIAARVALNELRRRKWRDVSLDRLTDVEADDTPSYQFASFEPSPESVIERADALQRVQRILAEELTERQRAAMDAIHMQGVPMEEVARRMGTNRNALYKLLHDARLRLKHRLEREGLPPKELLEMFGEK